MAMEDQALLAQQCNAANLWCGAGAPEQGSPDDPLVQQAMQQAAQQAAAQQATAAAVEQWNSAHPATSVTETPEQQAARMAAGDPTGGNASNMWNGTGAAPVVDTTLQPGQPFQSAGSTDIWGNNHSGAFYDNPMAFQPPNSDSGSGFYPDIFNARSNPPSGWFALDDYLGANAGRGASYGLPVQSGSQMQNSTNDYRLFGGSPGQFMINGHLIDFNSPSAAPLHNPPPDSYMHSGTGYNSGVGLGVPIAFTLPGWSEGQTFYGWPGDVTGYHSVGR